MAQYKEKTWIVGAAKYDPAVENHYACTNLYHLNGAVHAHTTDQGMVPLNPGDNIVYDDSGVVAVMTDAEVAGNFENLDGTAVVTVPADPIILETPPPA